MVVLAEHQRHLQHTPLERVCWKCFCSTSSSWLWVISERRELRFHFLASFLGVMGSPSIFLCPFLWCEVPVYLWTSNNWFPGCGGAFLDLAIEHTGSIFRAIVHYYCCPVKLTFHRPIVGRCKLLFSVAYWSVIWKSLSIIISHSTSRHRLYSGEGGAEHPPRP